MLWHDTKEEDADTYRFLREMAAKLDMPITEESDGRSVTELMEDQGMLFNNRAAGCSRILKQEPANRFLQRLQSEGVTEIICVKGFSANEPDRIQFATALTWNQTTIFSKVTARFPLIEDKVTKQEASDWCSCTMGVQVPDMYAWSDHANCVGCVRGGKAYWLAVKENRPDVFEQRREMENRFGHTFSGRYSLTQIEAEGLKRPVGRREAIEIGPCECGS